MDSEILYSLFGIIGFILVIYFTLKSTSTKINTKTKAKKKEEVIQEYKQRLNKALEGLDKDLRTAKKTELLKEFSGEFSRNIFFNEEEVRDIITTLSRA